MRGLVSQIQGPNFIAIATPRSPSVVGCPSVTPSIKTVKWSNAIRELRIENQDKFHYSEVNGARCKDVKETPPEGWDEHR